ncbi:hypothetical protein AUJ46_03895 [Candidatus Peregrinibacteria bacterium CG1_02_54_53]|nr:MAG: hypothetical protein AUJ46_03895 [Candidatus Peregrinibacteria bacterium CG1_02_54_53]
MTNPDAEKRETTGDPPSTVIRQWLARLPFKEQQILIGQWCVRKRSDAASTLRKAFDADDIVAFHDKIRALASRLGGEFARSESVLLGQLYVYMATAIPQDIHTQTRQMVQSVLGQSPRPSGNR